MWLFWLEHISGLLATLVAVYFWIAILVAVQ
jgi:hypothetical protein